MVTINLGEISVRSLDGAQYARVLALADTGGGTAAFPALYALADAAVETDPNGLMDEIVRLSGLAATGPEEAIPLGQLRDDLLTAISAASEG